MYFNGTQGASFLESPLTDEEETDGMLATNAVERFANFSRDGIGKKGADKPFFHAVGLHKCVSNLLLMLTIEVFM